MKKSKKEIEYQLSILRWLEAQPNTIKAIKRAHELLSDLVVVKIEKDDVYSADFLEFWAVYPKKVGKGDANKKFKSLITNKESKERTINSVLKHIKSEAWIAEDGKFIPNPATFLHQRRFDDEVETVKEKESKKIEERPEIKKCVHGYPLYVECPQCLKEKQNG